VIPEESAEDLYERAPCGYLSTLADGTIVRVNGTFLRWTGYEREDLVTKKRLSDLFTVGGRIFYETHFAPLLAMQGFVREVAMDVSRRIGDPLPVLVNAERQENEGEGPTIIRVSMFDATDRRKFERELIAARKVAESAAQAKSDFVSMISHELRTPLNAITGVAHLLSKTALSPQQDKYLSILQSSSENLLALINDILDFSKIEAGKVTIEKRVFDLHSRIYDVAHALGVKADEKKIELRVEIDPAVPRIVIGDPLKIGQILTNLVGNAVKFTSEGSVTIACRVDAEHGASMDLAVRVIDTGIGVAPERIATIFEDFTQESYDTSVRYGGTGLGLAIVRRLVELHGGKVSVESSRGEGSTFLFTLRVDVGPATMEVTPEQEDEGLGLDGVHALVADDNEVNVFVLSGMLKRWGVTYDVAADGKEAVALAKANEYDVVLMDLRMPELDGYDAAKQIRRLEGARANVPIIAVSASTRIGASSAISDAGFTEFVGKPVAPDLLADALRRVTGRKRR
jgi:PAS domain S-box-containing protein